MQSEPELSEPVQPGNKHYFFLSSPSQVDLISQNILGETAKTLAEGAFRAGQAVASGIYFFRLNAGDNSVTRKMALLK